MAKNFNIDGKTVKGVAIEDFQFFLSSSGIVFRQDDNEFHLTICINKKRELDIHISKEKLNGRNKKVKQLVLQPLDKIEQIFSDLLAFIKPFFENLIKEIESISVKNLKNIDGEFVSITKDSFNNFMTPEHYDIEKKGASDYRKNALKPNSEKLQETFNKVFKDIRKPLKELGSNIKNGEMIPLGLYNNGGKSVLLLPKFDDGDEFYQIPEDYIENTFNALKPIIKIGKEFIEEQFTTDENQFSFVQFFNVLEEYFMSSKFKDGKDQIN